MHWIGIYNLTTYQSLKFNFQSLLSVLMSVNRLSFAEHNRPHVRGLQMFI